MPSQKTAQLLPLSLAKLKTLSKQSIAFSDTEDVGFKPLKDQETPYVCDLMAGRGSPDRSGLKSIGLF